MSQNICLNGNIQKNGELIIGINDVTQEITGIPLSINSKLINRGSFRKNYC